MQVEYVIDTIIEFISTLEDHMIDIWLVLLLCLSWMLYFDANQVPKLGIVKTPRLVNQLTTHTALSTSLLCAASFASLANWMWFVRGVYCSLGSVGFIGVNPLSSSPRHTGHLVIQYFFCVCKQSRWNLCYEGRVKWARYDDDVDNTWWWWARYDDDDNTWWWWWWARYDVHLPGKLLSLRRNGLHHHSHHQMHCCDFHVFEAGWDTERIAHMLIDPCPFPFAVCEIGHYHSKVQVGDVY